MVESRLESQTRGIESALERLRADLALSWADRDWPRGVVGAFGPASRVQYGYPEIAGYWLRWASRSDRVPDGHGHLVIAWLQARGDERSGWPARIPAASVTLDPRYRQTTYLFDHCMLWDGVRCWAQTRGDRLALRLSEDIWRHMQTFVTGSDHGGARLVAARGDPVERWSGRVGPYLLKVCARAQGGGETPLTVACGRALPVLIDQAREAPHAESHPQLYAIEGMLGFGHAAEARQALRALLYAHGGLTGLRESVGGGPRRCDVLAQALRAAILCGMTGELRDSMAAAASMLAEAIDDCGRLPFALAPPNRSFPTWASLFAEQALSAWMGHRLSAQDII